MTSPSVRAAGVVASAGFLGIGAFQAVLALGAPFGKAAWGGGSAELAPGLRVASGIAVFGYGFAAAVVAQRSGVGRARFGPTLVRRGTWVLVALMAVGSLMNWASRSTLERFIWGPVTLVMAILCLVVARSPAGSTASRSAG